MYIRDFDTLSDTRWSSKHSLTSSGENELFKRLLSIRTDMATREHEFNSMMQDAFRTISSIRNEIQSVRETITNSTDDWGYSQVIRTRTDVSSSSHSSPNIEEPSSKSSVKKHKTNNINSKQKKRL